MIRIPIVKKLTAGYFIDVFSKEVKDNASLLNSSQVSTALDTSMAQYIPQSVFSRYLYKVLEALGPNRFIELINCECQKLVEGLLTQNKGLDFLASYSMHNRIHCGYEGERVVVSMDSSYPLAKQSKLNLADEIMAVYFVMYAIQKQIKGSPPPFGIRLQSPNTPLLDSLDLNVPLYLEHDATQIVFDNANADIKALVDRFNALEPMSLSENIELAIESYIGRTAIHLRSIAIFWRYTQGQCRGI
ncbi:hypothetical protein JCM19241_694 [Vibrio ishigakensis]|uniref:Uncharacterized protein n=1 Tax=Vibrio ishigakensis TaxID=1481914 RepID=A0A0B8QHF0_9VIBR|nr:hypothetical protein JCM19241_694 [Vibrio ishigakensis]